MCVCMQVYRYVGRYAGMWICRYVGKPACMHGVYVCVHIYIYVYVCVFIFIYIYDICAGVHVCIHICVYTHNFRICLHVYVA